MELYSLCGYSQHVPHHGKNLAIAERNWEMNGSGAYMGDGRDEYFPTQTMDLREQRWEYFAETCCIQFREDVRKTCHHGLLDPSLPFGTVIMVDHSKT